MVVKNRFQTRWPQDLCGIIGYVGDEDAAPLLVDALKRLEYRGYDSAGMAILADDYIEVRKGTGYVGEIQSALALDAMKGRAGIAHTRWATHGKVSSENAHPHLSCFGEVAVVHNGIIENHAALRRELRQSGHRFSSETDTEVIAHLLEENIRSGKSPVPAILSSVHKLRGSYAFTVLLRDVQDALFAARQDAPLVIGVGRGANFVASDVAAFVKWTDQVVFLENRQVAVVSPSTYEIYGFSGQRLQRVPETVAKEMTDISVGEYAHYTIKEIHEQPATIQRALEDRGERMSAFIEGLEKAKTVYLTGAGTSHHAALAAKYLFAKLASLRVEVVLASEFSHYAELLDPDSLLVAISQSGETADVLQATRAAKACGARVYSLVNVVGSTLDRETECSLYLKCGPEIGVAATKSFTSQLVLLTTLAAKIGGDNWLLEAAQGISEAVRQALSAENEIRRLAIETSGSNDFYFVGRSLHYPIALEAALKVKELSYVHAEGMAAGELKHGTLALIREETPVFALAPSGTTFEDSVSNAEEMKARGARVTLVTDADVADFRHTIRLPRLPELLQPAVEVIPLQLLAYHLALYLQRNPDRPRNLAKSVTVK